MRPQSQRSVEQGGVPMPVAGSGVQAPTRYRGSYLEACKLTLCQVITGGEFSARFMF